MKSKLAALISCSFLLANPVFAVLDESSMVLPKSGVSIEANPALVSYQVTIYNPYETPKKCTGLASIEVRNSNSVETIYSEYKNFLFDPTLEDTFHAKFELEEGKVYVEGSANYSVSCSNDLQSDPSKVCQPKKGACTQLCEASSYDSRLCAVEGRHLVYDPSDTMMGTLDEDYFGIQLPMANANEVGLRCTISVGIRAYRGGSYLDVVRGASYLIKQDEDFIFRKKILKSAFQDFSRFDLLKTKIWGSCVAIDDDYGSEACDPIKEHRCNWFVID